MTAALLLAAPLAVAQDVTVTGKVALQGSANPATAAATVVWLAPVGALANSTPVAPMHATLTPKNKSFEPHLLVVTRGSSVDFPNRDPWFHNVFSLFNGKRFDLGLYEAGTSRTVHFDREGVSFIFCNIHPEMSAVILALNTPYYGTTDRKGAIAIPNVPPGRYEMQIWHERVQPEALKSFTRTITVSDATSTLGLIHLPEQRSLNPTHKNKYGQDYENPTPGSPGYTRPLP